MLFFLWVVLASLMCPPRTRRRVAQRDEAGPSTAAPAMPDFDESESEEDEEQRGPRLRGLPDEVRPHRHDRFRFRTRAAQDFYFDELRRNRAYVPERGIYPDHLGDDRVSAVLEYLQWTGLARHPEGVASGYLAMEVITNIGGLGEGDDLSRVWVRGRYLDFSARAINVYFGLPDDGAFRPQPEGRVLAPAWDVLCTVVPPQLEHDHELRLTTMDSPSGELTQIWLGRVRPIFRSHIVLDHVYETICFIARGGRVNVGACIEDNLRGMRRGRGSRVITHIHLICGLCAAQGIRTTPETDPYDLVAGSCYRIPTYAARRSALHRGVPRAVLRPQPDDGGLILVVPPEQPPPSSSSSTSCSGASGPGDDQMLQMMQEMRVGMNAGFAAGQARYDALDARLDFYQARMDSFATRQAQQQATMSDMYAYVRQMDDYIRRQFPPPDQ